MHNLKTATLAAGFVSCVVLGAVAAPAIPNGTPIDEKYRKKFAECDSNNVFDGVQFSIYKNKEKKNIKWYPCKSDPSNFSRFERIKAPSGGKDAVLFVSNLALDLDGSDKACTNPGKTDNCSTSLMLDPTSKTPCVIKTASGKECVPVRADHIPYAVIPAAAPEGIDPMEFRNLTHLTWGDYGVVILKDKIIPVIVADGGPAYKIGEGSAALRKALSSNPRDFEKGVTFILFPHSRDKRSSLSPDTLGDVVKQKGLDLYRRLLGQH